MEYLWIWLVIGLLSFRAYYAHNRLSEAYWLLVDRVTDLEERLLGLDVKIDGLETEVFDLRQEAEQKHDIDDW